MTVVVVRDAANARFVMFPVAGGPPEQWPLNGAFSTNAPMIVSSGRLFSPVRLEGVPLNTGLAQFTSSGITGDTIRPPLRRGPEPGISASKDGNVSTYYMRFQPKLTWHLSPNGRLVWSHTDQYEVFVKSTDRITRILRNFAPVPVPDALRDEERATLTAALKRTDPGFTWGTRSLPRIKPAISDLKSDEDGRLWVTAHGPSEQFRDADGKTQWRARNHIDLYSPDFRYLARIELPPRFQMLHARGDHVWGVRRGEFDEIQIVRYRMRFSN